MSTLTPVAPARSLQQRRDALDTANVTRLARAQLKRDVKSQRSSALNTVMNPPQWADRMKVYDLLIASRGWGHVKTSRLLRLHDISMVKTVGGLSPRQRQALALALA